MVGCYLHRHRFLCSLLRRVPSPLLVSVGMEWDWIGWHAWMDWILWLVIFFLLDRRARFFSLNLRLLKMQ